MTFSLKIEQLLVIHLHMDELDRRAAPVLLFHLRRAMPRYG
ncbi:hypothetical protein ACFQDN_25605 [Pseudomonas asuensis]|nr:hypothetical protein [Pseudomonas asuensis]